MKFCGKYSPNAYNTFVENMLLFFFKPEKNKFFLQLKLTIRGTEKH